MTATKRICSPTSICGQSNLNSTAYPPKASAIFHLFLPMIFFLILIILKWIKILCKYVSRISGSRLWEGSGLSKLQPKPYIELYSTTDFFLQKQAPEVFYKKTVLKNFAIFTKHLCWSLFLIKLQASKKRLQHRGFPVNNVIFLRTPILKNICERLLLFLLFFQKNSEQQVHLKFTCACLFLCNLNSHRITFPVNLIVFNFLQRRNFCQKLTR